MVNSSRYFLDLEAVMLGRSGLARDAFIERYRG
jgi:hypothetical protein